MKYAYRMYRNTYSPLIRMTKIIRVPDEMESYRHRQEGYTEMLRVFDTAKEAGKAWVIDNKIAEYSKLSDKECLQKICEAKNRAKAMGISVKTLEASGIPSHTSLSQYARGFGGAHLDARAAVRAELIVEHLLRAIREARDILPGRGIGKYRHSK